ncbi:hypothetical protein BKM30_13990 [Pseudomonas syringae pv. syringae]|nr:hypothetical protein BKM27_10020 [Pseudomonas syringae pv. syringae]POR78102.1 hypothetical protein BKM30_13990 [Pseudomonas syringae pv. syringae]
MRRIAWIFDLVSELMTKLNSAFERDSYAWQTVLLCCSTPGKNVTNRPVEMSVVFAAGYYFDSQNRA